MANENNNKPGQGQKGQRNKDNQQGTDGGQQQGQRGQQSGEQCDQRGPRDQPGHTDQIPVSQSGKNRGPGN